MEQNQLMEDKALRQRNIHKVEVLSKVGGLLMLPGDAYATTEQVASFYGTPIETIYSLVKNNYDELQMDGYRVWKANDFRTLSSKVLTIETFQGGFYLVDENGNKIFKATNKGIGLFTKRAILRIGMLLQGSEVAKEVRTRLLNIYDAVTEKEKPMVVILGNILNKSLIGSFLLPKKSRNFIFFRIKLE